MPKKTVSSKVDAHFSQIENYIIMAIFADGDKPACRDVSDAELVSYVKKRMKASKADILLARKYLSDIAMGRFVTHVFYANFMDVKETERKRLWLE